MTLWQRSKNIKTMFCLRFIAPSKRQSPNTKDNSSICPALKKYGIPLDDTRVHQSILKDLCWLNKKNTVPATTLQCDLGDNKLPSFVFIPSFKDYLYMKKMNWLPSVLSVLGGHRNENESLLNLLTYIDRTESYRDV
jgi:hypothetical protein